MRWIAALVSCGRDEPDPSDAAAAVPFEPAPATLYRVTDAEWRNAALDLFGVAYAGALPVDYLLYNYSRVGASQLTVPPLDLELYEAAAWSVATAVAPDEPTAALAIGCAADDLPCVRGWLAGTMERAWRRPVAPLDLDELLDRYTGLRDTTGVLAPQAAVASVLLSPEFLFRVELGEPDPQHVGWRRYTSYEMAGRLGALLLTSVPDGELLRAAAAGELSDPDGVAAQVERLVATERARAALQAFFAETVALPQVDTVTKDAALYPEWTEALRDQAQAEVVALFTDVALDRDANLGEVLTSTRATVGPELAALYGVALDVDGALIELPADRGGLLGRVAILAAYAHNTTTSPTLRGKFIRTRLLCDDVPPPPPGVETEFEPLPEGTLRQQLDQHATDPVCASCHLSIDPPGFGLEQYDPIGRWRALDNGWPIDATGSLDGASFDGAAELGAVVAASPKYPRCVATQWSRYATGQIERPAELGTLEALGAAFAEQDDQRLLALVARAVVGDAFRLATPPLGGSCATEGATQACTSACGEGTETCIGGQWSGCTAPAASTEVCNGLDDDCNSAADDLERTCAATFGVGTEVCTDGAWGACNGPRTPDEVCNGVDDDLDGATDEELSIDVRTVWSSDLDASCDVLLDAYSPACAVAVSEACADPGCAVAGFGPVSSALPSVALTCLDESEATPLSTTFTALAGYHPVCIEANAHGGPCNAAINRLCAGMGLRTGFGPIALDGDEVMIACTPAATVLSGSYAVLSTYDSACNTSTRWGAACTEAIHAWCQAEGYATGHGPLENSGDLAIVACMGVL